MDILALACALVAAAIYYNTLYAGFVYDDRRAILTNADLKPSTPWSKLLENDFWGTPLRERGSHGSYRPLCVATYRLNYLLGGLEPFGYHLVNVFLHAICTALVVKIAKKVLPGQTLAQAISGLLFAVHPIHSEAVAGIVGRADLLACLFAEGAFLSYVAHYERSRPIFHLLLTILLSISATLAKETGISSLALCLLWDFCHSETLRRKMKNRWPSSTIVAGSLAIITLGRLRVGGGRAPEFASADNPVARHPSRLTRGLTFLYLPAASLSMLLCPCSLSFDWSMNAVPVINSITDPRNLLSILLYGSLLPAIIWALRKLKKPSCYNSPYPSYRHRTKSSLEQLSSYTSLSSISGCPSSSLTSTAYFLSSSLSPLSSSLSSASSSAAAAAAAAAAASSSCTSSSSSSLSSSLTGGASRCPVCAGRRINTYHTDNCRAANNNNGPVAECHCPKKKHKLLNNNRLLTATSSSSSSSSSNYNKLMPTSLLTIIGFLVFPFLPASNIFFYVGFVIAERILYLPSIGACLAIGAAIATSYNKARRKGSKRISRTILILTTILLTCMSARTLMRNVDWYNEENLYRSALRINPPKAYGNLGSVLSAQGRVDEAEEAFLEALRHRPNMADVHYNLGILQQGRRNYDEAILSYQRAIHFRPSLAQAYVNLGATLISVDRGTEAIAVLRAAASLDGSALKDKKAHEAARVQALLHLGSLYAEQGRLHKALSSYREALRMLPEHYPPQGVYNLLGETLSRLQQYNEAEKWFQASLASQPDHVPAHITYGKLLARNSSRVLEAERWFLRARRLAPQDPSVHHHYGLFLSSQGRLEEAASAHLEAASLGRMDYELAVAAASALRRASRCEEAELWYRHALGLRPSEARSHANLGAILHLNGKYKQAAAAYREALRLQPGDATTITNLHKLAALLV